MRILRVFDRAGDLVREQHNVTAVHVTGTGALVMVVTDLGDLYRVAVAPGEWAEVEEWTDVEPSATPTSDALSAPIEEVMPEPERLAQPVETPAQTSDFEAVHRAMEIVCICAQLRCPVVIGPAPSAEQRAHWSKNRFFRGGRQAEARFEQAPPFTRCSWEIGHNTTESPHLWVEGGWPYGINEHHPECPRHPDRYNRPEVPVIAGEGQPYAAGATPGMMLIPAATAVLEREPLILDDRPAGIPVGVDHVARQMWSRCAHMPPLEIQKEHPGIWCSMSINHDPASGHEWEVPGEPGLYIRW